MSAENPFARLEEAARRQDLEDRAAAALSKARTRIVLGREARSVFFATLALRLRPEVSWDVETLCTDGKALRYNPGFVAGLSDEERVGVVVHEVMHNALGHHARRGAREAKRWNVACDLAVNGTLLGAGFVLPAGRLVPGEGQYAALAKGLSAEQYYDLLNQLTQGQESEHQHPEPAEGQEGQGDAVPDPGGCGAVTEPGDRSQAAQRQSQAEWEVAVAQAQQAARQRGELPAGLARSVEDVLRPRVDWREVLREFISRHARNDYRWSPPNRRFVHRGLYLPGVRSEELGDLVVAIDTSGSVGGATLSRFAAEVQGILEAFDARLTVLHHDARVQHVQTWQSSDGLLVLESRGGGGTDHAPVFEWVERNGVQPAALVCLTDLHTHFPEREPHYPTLWCVVNNPRPQAPFGQVLRLE